MGVIRTRVPVGREHANSCNSRGDEWTRVARSTITPSSSYAPAKHWAMILLAVIGHIGLSYAAGQQSQPGKSQRSSGPGELPTDYDAGYDMGRRNMVKAIAELYKEEMKRQEKMGMEDAVMCDNGPKEISIFCHQAPEVSIVDLAADHRENNECLILNINAPDVSSKLVLKCDGSVGGDDFGWGEDW